MHSNSLFWFLNGSRGFFLIHKGRVSYLGYFKEWKVPWRWTLSCLPAEIQALYSKLSILVASGIWTLWAEVFGWNSTALESPSVWSERLLNFWTSWRGFSESRRESRILVGFFPLLYIINMFLNITNNSCPFLMKPPLHVETIPFPGPVPLGNNA